MKSTAGIKQAVLEEYKRASEMFGKANNGLHESYAVILEEFEEVTEETAIFQCQLQNFWVEVKNNLKESALSRLETMQDFAEKAAAEWIQVAAMCHKATMPKDGET